MGETRPARRPDTQLYNDVFNASPIGIVVENLDGQPLFVNPAFCSMLGFSEDELRSKHCVDFSPAEDAQKDWALFQQLRAGLIDHYQIEKRYFRRDGSLIWGSLSISLLKNHASPLVLAMVEDITEKKRGEEARFRHAAIVESSEDAIGSVTLDGVIASWNPAAQRIFGYTESEAVGKSVTMLVPPERLDEENRILETLKAGCPIQQFDTVRITKAGERINVSISLSPIWDSTGKIVGFSGISRNITERKRAEQRLREYEQAVEGAEDMIGVVDRQYRFLLANRQYLKMRNMTREQVVGSSIPDVLGKEIFEIVIKPKLDECFQGNVVTYEMKVSYPTVGERDLLVSYFPIEDVNGTIGRAACILHDITERKRAEEALHDLNRTLEGQTALLRTREELLRNFVKNVPAGVAMLDCDMRYLQASDRFCADYSIDSSRVLGHSHYELFPDIPDRWKEIHRRALQGETVRADEDRWDREDITLWVRWEIRPWWNSDGSQGGVLLFAEDITHIKQSEETLSKANQRLIQAHEEERARIARELHDDICQRIALLAVRLDVFCHGNPESLDQLKREMAQASEEAQNLGADVQALSHRLHSSKLKHLGLAAAAGGFCREFSHQYGVKIDFQSGDIPNELSEDISICIFRVLQEAVQNAAKHSGTRHFQVSLKNGSNAIELTVHDSGIGFDPELAFRRNGLGLTSMRERMKLVHGELSIESGLQRGTTVRALVPRNR